MKFTCEKNALVSAISVASRTVAQKSTIPALEGIYIRAGVKLTLSGYNLETGITISVDAEIQQTGACIMPSRLFFDIIRKLPGDTVSISVDEKFKVSIRGGISSFSITAMSSEDYPELPDVDDQFSVTLEQRTLKAMINQTSFAVSVNEARPIHTGALFEISDKGLTMVAVDGFRLALRREPLEHIDGGAFKFVAPGAALNEVEKICADTDDMVTVTQGKRHLMFEAGATQLICRRLEGEFLDYKNAIPTTNPICIEVDNKTMIESLDRVSVVISEKLKSPVRCLFSQDRVYMSARTGNGEARDICPVRGDGQELEIGFNNRYLMDALRYAPADTVKMQLNTGISPCIITPVDDSDNFLYMVLPVRLKAQ